MGRSSATGQSRLLVIYFLHAYIFANEIRLLLLISCGCRGSFRHDGSGFNATFPFLKRLFFDCPIKDFSIFKKMIAPTLKTLELSCLFFDLDFNNENIFQGLVDLQAPELRSVTLDVWVNAKRFDEKEFEKKMASLAPSLTKLNHAFETFKKQFIQKYPLEGNSDRSSVDLCVVITVSVFETDKEKVLNALKTNIDPSISIKFHTIETPSAEPIS
jgi:hypothetical protein